VAELPLGAPAVVARGGPASFIRVLHMVPGTVAELCRVAARGPAEDANSDLPLVVAAEAEPGDGTGGLQAAAVGFLGIGGAELRSLVVADEWRGLGVGSRVLAAWTSAAADRGARLVTAPMDDEVGFLARHGFTLLGRANAARLVRLL
jgi:GNAT superfamily N-acetyltransferase